MSKFPLSVTFTDRRDRPWNTSDFFVAYISLILFAVLYIGHKIILRRPFVRPMEADLDSGREELDDLYSEDKEAKTPWSKFWKWMG